MSLILRRSFSDYLRTSVKLFLGRLVASGVNSYNLYQASVDTSRYTDNRSRLTSEEVAFRNKYVVDTFGMYKVEQDLIMDIENASQYYNLKKIEQEMSGPVKIASVGCLYCMAESHYLSKHPDSSVYAMDFGNIDELNPPAPGLHLLPGYPLENLEKIGEVDYVIFSRTATLINPKELHEYMKVTKAKNIIFLEVAKLTTKACMSLDISTIDKYESMKMYSGMYLHNYPAILEEYGYEIAESQLMPPTSFNQPLDRDHYFIYVHGKMKNFS